MVRILLSLLLLALPAAALAGTPRSPRAADVPIRTIKLPAAAGADVPSGLEELIPRRVKTPDGSGWVTLLPAKARQPQTTDDDTVPNMPSAAIGPGLVYASRGFREDTIYALDAKTGRRRWDVKLEDNGPSTVTVTPRRIYACTESCTCAAITPRGGRKVWERNIGPNVAGAPTAVRERVYTAHATEDRSWLLTAMNGKTGEVIWQRPIAQDLIGAPVHHEDRLYLTDRSGVVSCFDLDGKVRWFANPRASSAPWVARGRLYLATDLAWRKGVPAVRCLEAATGRTVWSRDPEPTVQSGGGPARYASHNAVVASLTGWAADPPRPVVVGKRCVIAGGPYLAVLDADSGELEGMRRLPGDHRFHSAPAVLGKRLLFATFRGLLLEVEPRTGTVAKALDLRCAVTSQPVVADGRVVVTSRGRVISVPWPTAKQGEAYPQWGGSPSHDGRP